MRSKESLRREIGRLAAVWGVLVLLGAAEFAASFLPLPHSLRPLLLLLAGLMVLLVGVGFMEVRNGPPIVRAFAVAALFWLLLLLGLGSVDPLTRTEFAVTGTARVK